MNIFHTRTKRIVFFLLILATGFSSCRKKTLEKLAPAGGSSQDLVYATASIKKYYLYLPKDYYDTKKSYPVIVFLHGGTQIGASDPAVLTQVGVTQHAVQSGDFPFIVIAPLLVSGSTDWDVADLERVMNEVTQSYRIDPKQEIVSGFSLGGTAAWVWASTYQSRFAAINPIACTADQNVCNVKNIPLWEFHNRYDMIYTLAPMEQSIAELKACGGNVKFTIYDDGGHEGWTKAYNDPALYTWFSAQRKN